VEITYKGNELEVKIKDYAETQPFPKLFAQMKAVKAIIENLDFTLEMDEDFEISQKVFISILTSVGNLHKQMIPVHGNKSGLEVTKFILDFIVEQKIDQLEEYQEFIK
jgi:hypothetical protein